MHTRDQHPPTSQAPLSQGATGVHWHCNQQYQCLQHSLLVLCDVVRTADYLST